MQIKKENRKKDLEILEFNKFLEELANFTPNLKTKNKIISIKPDYEENTVKLKIKKTQEFLDILSEKGYFPLSEYPELDNVLNLLSIEESILSPKDLLEIKRLLNISRTLKNFLSDTVKGKEEINKLYRQLYSSRETERIIEESIDQSGMVKDSASRDLATIRKNIKDIEKEIINILEKIIHSQKFADIIQDKIITVRRDRYVIPVKQNFAGKIKGIIQDRSSSGQTIYLEPVNIVELNNRLSDLKLQEHIEIRRILKFLTDILRDKYSNLIRTYNAIVELDILNTIGKYSQKFNCRFPQISDKLFLQEAKHPVFLLLGKEFKPLTLKLGKNKKGLIITGPNTGGKTVALKTAGIIALLVQSGIPVPVSDGSEIPIFEGIFADIGDMQSIEQNLSTFSAHIKNIKEILENISDKSLILLDELIPGTDPDEGAAIGIGILHKIKEFKSYVMATTHFKQIKIFALSDDYFEVASVGFYKETLSPTYTLHYNSAGESMAFFIAEKIGFDKDILDIAKNYIDESYLKLEEAIRELEFYKTNYDRELAEISKLKQELKTQKEKYQTLVNQLQKEKEKRWENVEREAKEYLLNLRKEGYRILQEIKEEKSGSKLENFLQEKKCQFKKQPQEAIEEEINIGDKVRLKGKNTVGEVISVRENKVHVNFNGIKLWTRKSDIEKINETETKSKKTKFSFSRTRSEPLKTELKIIGKTKEEALKEVEYFIDKAIMEGISTIRIVHGYGSGILRKAVREYLDTLPYKIKYEDAPYNEGGMGVTIVYL